jgi:dihydropteroate synthase
MFDTTPSLDCRGRVVTFDRARVMGIVNVTPDSFSDGGDHATTEAAVAHGLRLAEEGADFLDVGGESTRPGAQPVEVEEELRRVIPVIRRLAAETSLPISVDTSKPEVMRAAVEAGAGLINDVHALRREGALDTAAALDVPVVLMHMQGEPGSMQDAPEYDDVVRRCIASWPSGFSLLRWRASPRSGSSWTRDSDSASSCRTTLHCWRNCSGSPISVCRCWQASRARSPLAN